MTEVERLLPADEALERICENHEQIRLGNLNTFAGTGLNLLWSGFFVPGFIAGVSQYGDHITTTTSPLAATVNTSFIIAFGLLSAESLMGAADPIIERAFKSQRPATPPGPVMAHHNKTRFTDYPSWYDLLSGFKVKPIDKISELKPGEYGFMNGFSLETVRRQNLLGIAAVGTSLEINYNSETHRVKYKGNGFFNEILEVKRTLKNIKVNREELIAEAIESDEIDLTREEIEQRLSEASFEDLIGIYSYSGIVHRGRFRNSYRLSYVDSAITDAYDVTKKKKEAPALQRDYGGLIPIPNRA